MIGYSQETSITKCHKLEIADQSPDIGFFYFLRIDIMYANVTGFYKNDRALYL